MSSSYSGYLNIPQADLAAEPTVHTFTGRRGLVAVVEFGAGVTIHVETAAGGRALAAAFDHAAGLLGTPAEAGGASGGDGN